MTEGTEQYCAISEELRDVGEVGEKKRGPKSHLRVGSQNNFIYSAKFADPKLIDLIWKLAIERRSKIKKVSKKAIIKIS